MPKFIAFCLFLLCLQTTEAQTRRGRDYALFFTAYQYDDAASWPELKAVPAEIAKLERSLRDLYGFEVKVINNATREDIVNTLTTWSDKKRYDSDSQLLLFFSMHGQRTPQNQGYLIPRDGGARVSSGKWLSHTDLRDMVDAIPCPRILVSLDACFSGAFGANRAIPGGTEWEIASLDCNVKRELAFKNKYPARKYLTAGHENDRAPANSKYAERWAKALQNEDDDGILSFSELWSALDQTDYVRPTNGVFGSDNKGDFAFIKKSPCGPAPAVDSDGDGVPDSRDKCPNVKGNGPDGCNQVIKGDIGSDINAWKKAKDADTEDGYAEYLRNFPQGEFKELAEAGLRRKQAEAAAKTAAQEEEQRWEVAKLKDTPEGYQKYLDQYPTGLHATEAKAKISADGLILIKGGTYDMGCTDEQQDCGDDEKPAHSVTVNDFYLGKYEVTQQLWQDIMGANPSSFKDCPQCPVERVSWDDVQEFLQKLNTKYPGRNYRLPTEAEWEYAAREGGKKVLFGNGKNVADPNEMNFNGSDSYKTSYSLAGTYRSKTTQVGSFAPNALGLYDMSGNVWEWCNDWYGADYYKNSPAKNPGGAASGSVRVLRGGSWGSYPQNCRVASRFYGRPADRNDVIGFRLARTK
ncbi:MAG: SUMF1/EgtB/PvdO family nonheme iron enzyme [Bacteroidota bacterium]